MLSDFIEVVFKVKSNSNTDYFEINLQAANSESVEGPYYWWTFPWANLSKLSHDFVM